MNAAFIRACHETYQNANLPPDPEGQNEDRALWAQVALMAFHSETGSDFEDCLCDLLADLMHFADRHDLDFNDQLARARRHYREETAPAAPAPADQPVPVETFGNVSWCDDDIRQALIETKRAVTPENIDAVRDSYFARHIEDTMIEAGWENLYTACGELPEAEAEAED